MCSDIQHIGTFKLMHSVTCGMRSQLDGLVAPLREVQVGGCVGAGAGGGLAGLEACFIWTGAPRCAALDFLK